MNDNDLMISKHLEKKLAKKGLVYQDFGDHYSSEAGAILFTTRDYAYSSGLIDEKYKFYPLEKFLKQSKLVKKNFLFFYSIYHINYLVQFLVYFQIYDM